MSVLIRVGRRKAILRGGRWLCADAALEQRLNEETRLWIQTTGGPPPAERDQEKAVAREIATRFGGRVLLRVPLRSPAKSAVVFGKLRQLELDFG